MHSIFCKGMQSFVDDRGKSQTISFDSLNATQQHEYISLQRSLLMRRECCKCGEYFRLKNTIGVPQRDHGRDHIDFETEQCAQWYEISMDTVVFKLLQAAECLPLGVLEVPGDTQCVSRVFNE